MSECAQKYIIIISFGWRSNYAYFRTPYTNFVAMAMATEKDKALIKLVLAAAAAAAATAAAAS